MLNITPIPWSSLNIISQTCRNKKMTSVTELTFWTLTVHFPVYLPSSISSFPLQIISWYVERRYPSIILIISPIYFFLNTGTIMSTIVNFAQKKWWCKRTAYNQFSGALSSLQMTHLYQQCISLIPSQLSVFELKSQLLIPISITGPFPLSFFLQKPFFLNFSSLLNAGFLLFAIKFLLNLISIFFWSRSSLKCFPTD